MPFESAGVLFRDGSMQNDIPLKELAAQFHATHFIVSQATPPPPRTLRLALALVVRRAAHLPRLPAVRRSTRI